MWLITALLVTNAAALAPPLRTLLSRSAKPKAREEAITLITEMEREERDKFLDYVNTVRDTPSKLARRPLMRYAPMSWPARDLAALDRVLDIGGIPEDEASKRRAVLSTLRQLANTRGVLRLEREARRRARLSRRSQRQRENREANHFGCGRVSLPRRRHRSWNDLSGGQ